MKPEDFNPQDYLPQGYYPWPDLINSNIGQMEIDMNNWIDQDYAYLPEKARRKYKKMGFHLCTARMVPKASYEQTIPCNRFVLNFVVMDDQMEFATIDEKKRDCDRAIEILQGSAPAPNENGIFQHLALIRDEYKAFMPPEWLERFTENLSRCFKYGVQEETPFKLAKRIPSLEYFMILREYSVNMYPYLYWADIETNFVLPKYIEEHPVIQRLRALTSRIEAWQNDFYSLRKEMGLDTELMNLILVLQKGRKISLEEAVNEAKRIHDEDVAEFVALHENLPDFGNYQQRVYDYITSLGTILQVLNTHYIKDTERYLAGGEGFAWPEGTQVNKYKTQDFRPG
jgi:hypothetical protein